MNFTKLIIKWTLIAAIAIGAITFIFFKTRKPKEKELFQTSKLERRTIVQAISATGATEAEGTLNIGSLVNGIVESLHVEENQEVKKGQLLAMVDDGKGNTSVKRAEGFLNQAKAALKYQKAFYARQKKLFEDGHISPNEFDLAQQGIDNAIAQVESQQAFYEQNLLEFNNKKIVSPIDGIVIKKNVSLREGVANFSPPTILYTIAADIKKMNVELEIDETDIGLVSLGYEANLFFDTYPDRRFFGKITEIGVAPIARRRNVVYKAVIKIDNTERHLKPGMTVRAQIVVGFRTDALAIPGYLFAIDKKLLKRVAEKKGLTYSPISAEKIKAFSKTKKKKESAVRTIWIFDENSFIEKPVELGVTDQAFFEVLSGLDGSEEVIIDVDEPDQMKQMYKKMFGGGLGQNK